MISRLITTSLLFQILMVSHGAIASRTEMGSSARPQRQSGAPIEVDESQLEPLRLSIQRYVELYSKGRESRADLNAIRDRLSVLRARGVQTPVSPDLDDEELARRIQRAYLSFSLAKRGDREDFEFWCLKWGAAVVLGIVALNSWNSRTVQPINPVPSSNSQPAPSATPTPGVGVR